MNDKLPPNLKELVDEMERLKAKKAAAVGLGLAQVAKDIGNLITPLEGVLGKAIQAEAKREAGDLKKQIANVAAGEINVAPGDDQVRIADAEAEMQRIRDKLKKANEIFDGDIPADVRHEADLVQNGLDDVLKDIGRAAVLAAEREYRELKEAVEDIKKGKDKKPDADTGGPGPKPTPTPTGGGTGGGGQTGGGGTGTGDVDSIGDGGTRKEPPATTIYVRSDNVIWAWGRRGQEWLQQEFRNPIIDVQIIRGGLLVIAAEQAVLFDSALGQWLVLLDSAPETLLAGGAGAPSAN